MLGILSAFPSLICDDGIHSLYIDCCTIAAAFLNKLFSGYLVVPNAVAFDVVTTITGTDPF